MGPKEFSEFFSGVCAELILLEEAKSLEYSGEKDRFAQFRRIADSRNRTPEDVLMSMVWKHWDTINTEVEKALTASRSGKTYLMPDLKPYTRDVIVYMLLLEGLQAAG